MIPNAPLEPQMAPDVPMQNLVRSGRHPSCPPTCPGRYNDPARSTGAHRPTPALGQYTVPGLDGFYLVGPFQHPGGGVFGAGRATAMKVFEALKLDFAKLGRIK